MKAELSPACAILTLPSVNCAAVSVLDPILGLFFFSSKTVVLTCGIVSARSPLNKDLRLLMASRLAGPPPYGIVTPSATAYSPNFSSTSMESQCHTVEDPQADLPLAAS